jgi:hypothetical protein
MYAIDIASSDMISSRVRLTLDEVLYWRLDLLTTLTRLVATLNHSAVADFQTLKSLQHTLSFQSVVFTSRSLVTACNSGDFSTAPTKSSIHRFP